MFAVIFSLLDPEVGNMMAPSGASDPSSSSSWTAYEINSDQRKIAKERKTLFNFHSRVIMCFHALPRKIHLLSSSFSC